MDKQFFFLGKCLGMYCYNVSINMQIETNFKYVN